MSIYTDPLVMTPPFHLHLASFHILPYLQRGGLFADNIPSVPGVGFSAGRLIFPKQSYHPQLGRCEEGCLPLLLPPLVIGCCSQYGQKISLRLNLHHKPG